MRRTYAAVDEEPPKPPRKKTGPKPKRPVGDELSKWHWQQVTDATGESRDRFRERAKMVGLTLSEAYEGLFDLE